MQSHDYFISLAISEAHKSLPIDVPVGALIVNKITGEIISTAYNEREKSNDATHHAEVLAIQRACEKLKTRRLSDYSIYITLEPCVMCSGALIQAQIGQVIFGAHDLQYGAAGSIYNFFADPRLPHNTEVLSGILEDECTELLNSFFKEKR